MYKFSNKSIGRLEGVHPKMKLLMAVSIKGSPVDFMVISGVRTAKEQNKLYQQGRTVRGQIVTSKDGYKRLSNHQVKSDGYGYAVDICPYVKGRLDWNNIEAFDKIARHIKEQAKILGIRIVWGGDWKQLVDKPHYEMI